MKEKISYSVFPSNWEKSKTDVIYKDLCGQLGLQSRTHLEQPDPKSLTANQQSPAERALALCKQPHLLAQQGPFCCSPGKLDQTVLVQVPQWLCDQFFCSYIALGPGKFEGLLLLQERGLRDPLSLDPEPYIGFITWSFSLSIPKPGRDGEAKTRPFLETHQHISSFYIPSNSPVSPQNVYLEREEVSLMLPFLESLFYIGLGRTFGTQQPKTESFFLFFHPFQGRVIRNSRENTHQ